METARGISLREALADQPVGRWVILDPSMSRVLSSAETPEEALRKSDLHPAAGATADERPVLLQVPDPHMLCLF